MARHPARSAFEKGDGHAATPPIAADEKTRDRPDRRVIDRGEDSRSREPNVVLSGRERAPAHDLVAGVREQSGRRARSGRARACVASFLLPWLSSTSDWPMRHHVHQHPAHAPFLPKSDSKSSQRSGVRGRMASLTAFARGHGARVVASEIAGKRRSSVIRTTVPTARRCRARGSGATGPTSSASPSATGSCKRVVRRARRAGFGARLRGVRAGTAWPRCSWRSWVCGRNRGRRS